MLKIFTRLEMFSRLLLVIGGIMYGYTLLLNKRDVYNKSFGSVLIFVGLYWMFNRDYYLPFLGRCAMPPSLISEIPNVKVDGKVPIKLTGLPPNTQIMYWASVPLQETIMDPQEAYGDYKNSGITMSNEFGEAFARVDCPSNYTVGMLKFKLTKHIHYRYAIPEYKGLYSRVYTADVEC